MSNNPNVACVIRLLVTGSQKYPDRQRVIDKLDKLRESYVIDVLAHGSAKGVDHLAGLWARDNDIPVQTWPAKWKLYNTRAGPIRNRLMLKEFEPDLVVAFWDGISPGTKDMISIAHRAGIEVIIYMPTGD